MLKFFATASILRKIIKTVHKNLKMRSFMRAIKETKLQCANRMTKNLAKFLNRKRPTME